MKEDTWIVEVLDYVFSATAPKNRKLKNKPFIKKFDQLAVTEDLTTVCTKSENGAPTLYLFFESDMYECALISADEQIITCKSSLENALLCFIGVYSVFHVGYAQDHANFLSLFELAILNKDTSAISHPIGWIELMKKVTEVLSLAEK